MCFYRIITMLSFLFPLIPDDYEGPALLIFHHRR